jgi:cell division protein FtsX
MNRLNFISKIGYQILTIARKGVETCFRHMGVNLLTIAVIAASLFLFAASYLIIHNGKIILSGRDSPVAYSVFLKDNSSPIDIETLLNKIRTRPDITRLHFGTNEEAH